jgi:DNA (cytosine-5)-methyltransferase 1
LPYDGPKTSLQRSLRRLVPPGERRWIHDHITRSVRLDDLEAFQLLPEGGTYDQLPASLQRYRTDIFTDKYKRLVREGLSRTITAHIAKDGYSYIHPTQHRTLSVREAARVQTFPDGFRFAGEPSHRYRQIGNAVPPLLAQAIGHALRLSLQARPRPQRDSASDFRSDLLAWHRASTRPHPWRVGHSPWHVLMAEMCLHRTRADQVGSIFGSLVQIAPTPRSMVEHAAEVRSALGRLGVRWRVENMLKVASTLVELHDEVVPDTLEGLLSLPGVGDYVASAVLCFGFGRTAILMDTNTERIATRTMGHTRSKRRWQLRLDLYRLAGSQGADAKFNFAMLDLGRLVCRAAEPRCLSCPVNHRCASFQPQAVQG